MSDSIPPLEMEELDEELRATLQPRVTRLKYLGEFFKLAGHVPKALLGFIQFTEEAKSLLDKKTTEIIALTVASMKGNEYERNQHERLSVKLGYGSDWVTQVEALAPDEASLLSDDERNLQRFVIAKVESDGRDETTSIYELAARVGAEQAIAILMVMGRYTTHALLVNTLKLAPPVPSIFEDGFTGK